MVCKPPYSFKRLVNVYKVRLNVYKVKRKAHAYPWIDFTHGYGLSSVFTRAAVFPATTGDA